MAHSIDTLIRNGRVVDGTGSPWFHGDVALRDGRILTVQPPHVIEPGRACQVLDVTGMVVCPGFIDIQSHSIVTLMMDGRSLSKITQGVTTEIMGEGWTPAPFGGRIQDPIPEDPSLSLQPEWRRRARNWRRFSDWLEAMEQSGVSPNIGSFFSYGTAREYAKYMDMGPATGEERAVMRRLVVEAMEEGAFGLATALVYPPESFSSIEELIELCHVVAEHGGIYITHLRSEGERLFQALDEAIAIGQTAGLAVEIYHLKAMGRSNWQKMAQVIARIDQAREDGVDITADMYPYVAAGTGLDSVLPPWSSAEGKLFDHLRDPAKRREIRSAVEHPDGDWEPFGREAGPAGIMPVGFERPENRAFAGMRLSEIAAVRDQDWIDTAMDLLLSEGHRIDTIYFLMDADNLALQLRQPWMKISTDAGGVDPEWAEQCGPTHPRTYGTYPRVLAKYVREKSVLTLEDAIRKMSSAVASRLGLWDRGVLRPGCWADVVVFDPQTIQDHAEFDDSHRLSSGVRHVWINGVPVLAEGRHTGARPGRVVRGPAAG